MGATLKGSRGRTLAIGNLLAEGFDVDVAGALPVWKDPGHQFSALVAFRQPSQRLEMLEREARQMDRVFSTVLGLWQVPRTTHAVNVVPLRSQDFTAPGTRSKNDPDCRGATPAEAGRGQLLGKGSDFGVVHHSISWNLCATDVAFGDGVERVSLDDFSDQSEAEHLLQICQQHVGRPKFPFGLRSIENGH